LRGLTKKARLKAFISAGARNRSAKVAKIALQFKLHLKIYQLKTGLASLEHSIFSQS
jgi:hypothetical protein